MEMLSKILSCLPSYSNTLLNSLWDSQYKTEITWTNAKSEDLQSADDNRLINKSTRDMQCRTDSIAKSAQTIILLLINHW